MKVKFLPQNLCVPVESGKSVMEIAKQHQLPVSSSCNGMGTCAECRVYVVEGEAHVLPPTAKEVELIGGGYFLDNRRLSCQLLCFGDVTVDLSEQVERTQKQRGITKKFLKKIDKEEVSSLGGVLVEQDQEIKKLAETDVIGKVDQSSVLSDNFYATKGSSNRSSRGGRHHSRGRRSASWNNARRKTHRHNRLRNKHGRKY